MGGPNVTTVPCSFVSDRFITLHAFLAIYVVWLLLVSRLVREVQGIRNERKKKYR